MTMVGSDGWCVCATQENLIAYAQGYSDEFADGHPAVVKPEDRQWSYDPAFPLAEMVEPNGRPFDAVAWSAEYTAVKQAWAEQGEPDRFDDMEGWWLSSPHEEPMILVEGADGKIHKWDGFHRIGISMTHGATHVPAVVGRRDHKGT